MSSPQSTSTRSRKPLIAAALVIAMLVGAAGWYFFIRDDSPPAFDIDSAAEGATTTAGDDGTTTTNDADAGAVEGDWAIDPDAGAAAGGTSAGFRVDEELAGIGASTAVGRTEGVEGSLTIDGTTVTAVEISVDLASLETDDSRRDGRMRSALATDEFPAATFSLTNPIDLGPLPTEGETISVTATGDMTIKGVTKAVDIALDAELVGGTLVVVGSTPVVFVDYGIDKPTAPIVVSIEDEGIIEFQLFFTKRGPSN